MAFRLDTKIEDLELAPKLETRLKLCKAATFADVMAINPADWANVTPKVVNALRRFQSANRQLYVSLGGKPVQRNADARPRRRGPQDEQRFFVANNILNAYASAGMLYGERPVADVMAEIVDAADAFMAAFYPSAPETTVESPILEQPSAAEHVAERAESETAAMPAKGDKLVLTEYFGHRANNSKSLRVGAVVEVLAVADEDGRVAIRGRVDGKPVKFLANLWSWDVQH